MLHALFANHFFSFYVNTFYYNRLIVTLKCSDILGCLQYKEHEPGCCTHIASCNDIALTLC